MRFNLVVDADAIAQVTDARLNEKAAVGVGLEGKQLAKLCLEMHSALEESQGRGYAAATDDFAIDGSDALTQDVDPRSLDLVAENEVSVGGEEPVALALENDTASDGVCETIVGFGVKGREQSPVGHLEHGGWDGFFLDVACILAVRQCDQH